MPDYNNDGGWTPLLVQLNTGFTMLGGVSGIAALVIALVALLK